ncbi:SCO3242 family prenyltransferase [Streptomyces decoyicus]|uniref:SCO3242 family prenyltransferase n=1 Tax=Streptomyces decoyicus TaxID=249567 RepID=UPI00363C7E8D
MAGSVGDPATGRVRTEGAGPTGAGGRTGAGGVADSGGRTGAGGASGSDGVTGDTGGAGAGADGHGHGHGHGNGTGRSWAELLRVSALFSVPGDLLAGATAAGHRPNHRTALATCASLCLYEAGMALNDWADRDIDAVERPGRPIPSGRIAPAAALTAAGGLTVAGLALAAAASRPALLTATALAATVWAYDLHLKNTPAGPAAMACARTLDLLQGAVATAPPGTTRPRPPVVADRTGTPYPSGAARSARAALPSALLLGAHTLAVTTVSRREAQGSSSALPLAGLAAVAAVAAVAGVARGGWGRGGSRMRIEGRGRSGSPSRMRSEGQSLPAAYRLAAGRPAVGRPAAYRPAVGRPAAGSPSVGRPPVGRPATPAPSPVTAALLAGYAATAARPLLHAALNPSPYFLQRAVGGGIRAMIPLQAALTARAGAPRTAAALLALIPAARRLSRKVSPT